jgi:hypothetical protein
MAIKRIGGVAGPNGSIPTAKGWVHPRTGELLKSQRITQEQLDEYNGVQLLTEPTIVEVATPEIEIEEEVEEIVEAPKPKKKAKAKKKKFGLFG